MAACPRCGERIARRARFCSACGYAVGAAAPQRRTAEELKVVTVVFVDLVSFTQRSELLHPEEVAGLIRPYHSRVRVELERYGGRVEKFIGDAVMAIFGAPVAHEDDPERAVRAAFALRAAIAELNAADPARDLRIRVGIATGEALVALDLQPAAGEGMAAGDVVNTASRLESAAPVDGILASESTVRGAGPTVEWGGPRELEIRGKREPVRAREALSVRPRHALDLARRGFAPLVGRDHELRLLAAAAINARDRHEPCFLTLLGPPGIGKTRLLWELFHALDDTGAGFMWRQGRSLPYGEGVAYWALGDLVKTHAAMLESDPAQVARRKLRQAVEAVVADPDERRWIERYLLPLAGLGSSGVLGESRRAEAFAAWRRFVEALAASRPLVLVLEDVQWADDGLLDFVEHLAEWVRAVPLVVLTTARLELLDRRPRWNTGGRVALEALSTEDTDRLVRSLVGELEPGAARRLAAATAGNPLYAEEYAAMVADAGPGAEVAAGPPESVQRLIAARLDALPPDEKALLQTAAVVGRTFWTGAVAAVSRERRETVERVLDSLSRRQFVRPQPRTIVEGEEQHAFWHGLVADVAYGELPRAVRAERHRRAAEWVTEVAGDRLGNLADVLAHHYGRAVEFARATGQDVTELAVRARGALAEAGDRALELAAFGPAARSFGAALELTPHNDPALPSLLLRTGTALFWAEGSGAEELERASEALRAEGDSESAADADVLRSRLCLSRGERDRAFELGRGAVELLRARPPSRAAAQALANLSGLLVVSGETTEAARLAQAALALADELGLDDLAVHARTTLGLARAHAGEPRAIGELEAAADEADRLGSLEAVRAHANLGSLLADFGDLGGASERFARARAAAERFGDARGLVWLAAERLYELLWSGAVDEAHAAAETLVAEAEAGGRRYTELDARHVRAAALLARGDVQGAVTAVPRVLELARAAPDPQALHPSLALAARVAAAAGDLAGAGAAADELIGVWEASGRRVAGFWTADLAFALDDLGRGRDFSRAFALAWPRTHWLEAAERIAASELDEAAEAYGLLGSLLDATEARRRAALRRPARPATPRTRAP